jgi:hypothetical protein
MPDVCRRCKALVLWGTDHHGKRVLLDADGTPHKGTCPYTKRRKSKRSASDGERRGRIKR